MSFLLQDLRYGFRMLVKNPLLSLAAIVSLGLGIGANATIFTLVNAVFLNPLGVREPDQLASVFTTDEKLGSVAAFGDLLPVSYPNYKDLRDHNQVFSGLAAYQTIFLNFADKGQPQQIIAEIVSGNYFQVLGIRPALGRCFLPQDDGAAGAYPVVVLSHRFWKKQFGADRSVIGRTLTLNSQPFTVVGVADEGFEGTNKISTPSLWVPIAMRQQVLTGALGQYFDNRRAVFLNLVGRLKPEMTAVSAESALQGITLQLKKDFPIENDGRSIAVRPLTESNIPAALRRSFLLAGKLLMVVVGLVLLIACANVANLLLAWSLARRKEISMRLALGAGRARLVRQLLTESVLLSLLGGGLGLLLAQWGPRLLWASRPPELSQSNLELNLDLHVLGFTLVLSLLTGLLFGLAPALRVSKPDLVSAMKAQGVAQASGGRRLALPELLIVAQVALSVVALIGAGLFLTSLIRAQRVDPGFEVKKLAMLSFDVASQGYRQPQGEAFYRRVVERASEVPGVASVSLGTNIPLSLVGIGLRSVAPEGQKETKRGEGIVSGTSLVGPRYFETLGIRLLEGRDFNDTDRADSRRVVVVNQAMAKRISPDGHALGRRLSLFGETAPLEIVGIAADSKYLRIGEDPQPFLYIPWAQSYPNGIMTLFIRAKGDPGQVLGTVRGEIQALDRNLPLTNLWLFADVLRQSLWTFHLAAILLILFGLLALVLTAIGIYGVVAHSVGRRRREIGIRMALGAQRTQILGLVLRRGVVPLTVGLAIGMAGALALSRAIAALLYQVQPTDLTTYSLIGVLLLAIGLLANLVPARRASAMNPKQALISE